MPILIIEQNSARQAGRLNGRVLIGRWPENTIVVDDKAVSRIHAWVGIQDGRYYIADTGSRTGTIVNGQPLLERRFLVDFDVIQIGPAFIRYRAEDPLPPEMPEIDLTARPAAELSGAHGEFMDCICGAPLWLPRGFIGVGQCRYCGHTVTRGMPDVSPALVSAPASPPTKQSDNDEDDFNAVMDAEFSRPRPKPQAKPLPEAGRRVPPPAKLAQPAQKRTAGPTQVPRGQAPPPIVQQSLPPSSAPAEKTSPAPNPVRLTKETACGVCHSPITIFDEVIRCPACNVIFHGECWTENRGCSSYGCSQVGILDAK